MVSIQVVKKGGENLLSTTDKIYEKLDMAKKDGVLPKGVDISITKRPERIGKNATE
ncbi:MAG: hypothetical protein MZV63_04245 [Marinilabiliales bacterium]|nr:hypothetical protein [Marinilabiliales bacterium]